MRVCALVFTQGVNEMQTLANMSGESYRQAQVYAAIICFDHVLIIMKINVDSAAKLKSYVNGYMV